MAFDPANLAVAVNSIGGGSLRMHFYKSDDDLSEITSEGFITRAASYGLRVGDLVFIAGLADPGSRSEVGFISAISGGNGTIQIQFDDYTTYVAVPPPTGDIARDTAAIAAADARAAALGRPLSFPPGVYMTSGGLTQTTNWVGAGCGAWAPSQLWGEARDMAGTIILVAQTPSATHVVPFISNMDVSGGVVANASSRNANDTHYRLTDLTNANANEGTGQGATPRALTYGVRVPPGRGLSMKGIRIMLSFNGAATTEGHFRAYINGTGYDGPAPGGLGSVSCDVGLLIDSHEGYVTEDCQFVGYWRVTDKLIPVVLTNDVADPDFFRAGAENQRFVRCLYQGMVGVMVRGADLYQVIAAGSDWIEIPWSDSHTFHSSYTLGRFRCMTAGSSSVPGTWTYTGQSKISDRLRLTGVTPNPTSAGVTLGHTVSPSLYTKAIAGMVFRDPVFTGLNHTSLLPSEDLSGLGLKPSACIEVSGRALRSIIFENATLRGHDSVAGHFHEVADVTCTANTSAENFDGVSATGGSPIGSGMRWIASPAASANTRVTYPAGATYRFTISEIEATGFSDIRPKYGSTAPSRFNGGGDTGLFEPLQLNGTSIFNLDGSWGGPTNATRGISDDANNVVIGYNPSNGNVFLRQGSTYSFTTRASYTHSSSTWLFRATSYTFQNEGGTNVLTIGANGATAARTGSAQNNDEQSGENIVTKRLRRSSDDGSAAEYQLIKTRGMVASPASANLNDSLGGLVWRGYTNSLVTASYIIAQATENHGASALGTRLRLFLTPTGSTTPTEHFRFDPDTGFNMGGTNVVIDASRMHHDRVFTVGALPTPGTAGRSAWASNCRAFNGAGTQEGGGAGTGCAVNDNGTNWKIAGTNVTAVA